MNDLHHPCEDWAEPISLAAAGCLSSDEEGEVRRHLDTCRDCRERFRQLAELCGGLDELRLPTRGAEAGIVERIMSAVTGDESQRPLAGARAKMDHPGPVARSLDTWRWIMRSRVSRVAAAAMFVLAIAGVALWFHGSSATLAFADFVAPILEAKTARYKQTVEMKGPPAVTITSVDMMLDATRSRSEIGTGNVPGSVQITDWSQGKTLFLIPALKQATIHTYANTENVRNDPATWVHVLQMARDGKNLQSEPLGEKEIDGRRVVGFRISGDHGTPLDLWGDPKTGMPVRLEMTMGIDGSTKLTLSDFEFNVDLDPSLFSVEPPTGYTVRTEKIDLVPDEEKDLIGMFREYTRLNDGAFPDALDMMRVPKNVWTKLNVEMQWERMVGRKGKAHEKEKRKYEELTLKMVDETPNAEQMGKLQKEMSGLLFGMLWEELAPENLKANEELKQKFEEAMLKSAEGGPNEEHARKIEEEIRKIGGDEMLEAMKARNVAEEQAAKEDAGDKKSEEVRNAQFMEAQRCVSRGLQFANQLAPSADAHYLGKGVSLGAADTPVFWYRPKDSKNYRVVYADLTVREADAAPNVSDAQPVETPTGPKK